ncbi:MAG: hypothetical protein AB7O52_08350 [Planctomycetota bacterium]
MFPMQLRTVLHRVLPVAFLTIGWFALPATALGQSSFVRGDANGDLAVNISDPVTLLAYLFNGGTIGCQSACDANDDGQVNLGDAVYLLGAIFSGGNPPPSPYPTCGPDPSADALTCVTSPCPTQPPVGQLREVDVAFLGSTTGGVGRVVSVTGTGAQHQLTSWSVSNAGALTELATTAPIDGHHPRVKRLAGVGTASTPRFVTSTILADGNLFLTSRRLNANGTFVNSGTIGYGSNASVEVLSYDLAVRPIFAGPTLTEHQVVTVIVAEPTAGGARTLRVVSWRVTAATGAVTGLEDSGNLPLFAIPQNGSADELAISISHLNGIQYVLTYTNSVGQLENRFFWVEDDGHIVYAGGSQGGQNIRGTDTVNIDQDANAVARVTDSGFVTASRLLDGTLSMSVWERRDEGFINFEPYLLTDNSLDLSPNGKGVFPATPALTNAWRVRAGASDLAGTALATGDFNGDGYQDAVIGVPRRDAGGFSDSGAIFVIHGDSTSGVRNKPFTQEWSQGTAGIAGAAEDGDRLGESIAVGDFDGDGIDDVAVGAPYEDIGATSAGGAVNVIYGTPFGLASTGNVLFTQEALGHTSAASDLFGRALAAGDFDEDGRDDLAISAPGREVGPNSSAGVVYVLFGTATGLTSTGNTLLHQDSAGIMDTAEPFDEFGRSLTTGDFNGDGNDDLVIGVPGENVGAVVDAGAVHIIYGNSGSANGFSANNFVSQGGFEGGLDILGALEAEDAFGASVAAGDFDGDGADDLAIGVPGEAVGSMLNAGAVNILYGTFLGLTHVGNQIISLDEFNPNGGNLPDIAETSDSFGFALATGDVNGDGDDDLIVGAPGKGLPSTCSASSIEDVGAFFQILGSVNGLTPSGATMNHQNWCVGSDTAAGVGVVFDRYAQALAVGDFNADGEDDLVVGIPNKDTDDEANCGAIHLLDGSASGLSYTNDEEWFIRVLEQVRGIVTDMAWEDAGGPGSGRLFSKNEFLPHVHVASVTKTMTLLLAVEAIEAGLVDELDDIDVSSLAGTTGGSYMELWDMSGPVLDMGGNEIRFLATGDTMPLDMLLHGMMMRSCNRSSVAIGEEVALQVMGDSERFVDMMNARASAIGMPNTVCGHPAGGMVTKVQDLINLLMEGWEHPMFREIMGRELFGDTLPALQLCGTDINGAPKCNSPFTKLQTIGDYPGRLGWKGGNGRLWWGSNLSYGYPFGEPDVPSCISSAVAVVERADREIAMALQQTGDRTGDSQDLLDFGVRKVFTPDRCDEVEYPAPGGIVGPEGPIRVRAFAVDGIENDGVVTAVIDDYEELRINVWGANFVVGALSPLDAASTTYTLPPGTTYAPAGWVRMARLDAFGAIGDYVTATLDGTHLDLEIWRVGETP